MPPAGSGRSRNALPKPPFGAVACPSVVSGPSRRSDDRDRLEAVAAALGKVLLMSPMCLLGNPVSAHAFRRNVIRLRTEPAGGSVKQRRASCQTSMGRPFTFVAVVSAFNEEDVIGEAVAALIEEGDKPLDGRNPSRIRALPR